MYLSTDRPDNPPVIQLQPDTVYARENVTATCLVDNLGSPPADQYLFQLNGDHFGEALPNENWLTFTTENNASHKGDYTCTVSNNVDGGRDNLIPSVPAALVVTGKLLHPNIRQST